MPFLALSKYQKLKHKRLRNDCFGPKWMCSQNTIKNKEEIALLYMLHLVHTSVSNFAIISVSVLNF